MPIFSTSLLSWLLSASNCVCIYHGTAADGAILPLNTSTVVSVEQLCVGSNQLQNSFTDESTKKRVDVELSHNKINLRLIMTNLVTGVVKRTKNMNV